MEQETRPARWSPEDSLSVKGVGAPRVSPDGMRAAYTVTEPLMTDEKSEFITQVWLARTDGTDAYQATFSEKSSENPRWSPDGRFLAFTSKRGEKSRLYVMRLAGGEPEALTDGKADVGDYRWSPDGSQIAFLMTDAPTEDEEKRKKAKDDWTWKDEEHKYSRLYVVAVEKDAEGKRDPRLLTSHDRHIGRFDWSPDGAKIVYDHMLAPPADYWTDTKICVVDVAAGEVTPLIDGPHAAMNPFYSPDGRSIAFVRTDDPPRWYFRGDICIVPSAGGEARALPISFDENPGLIGWSADGSHLYFQEPYHTTTRLYSLSVVGGEIETLYSGGQNADFNLNAARTWMGFSHQTPTHPVEAFVAPLDHFAPRPISQANQNVRQAPLGRTESIRWTAADGHEIEGLLTLPPEFKPGAPVPLLLVIHGGPAGVFSENFPGAASVYPTGVFASHGFAVLRCNPRGSSGYGSDFRIANYQDWGGSDFQDLMRGVDTVVENGIADPDRLGVMGWSYGGFMTSWTITQTKRFKAASVGAAVTNLTSMNGTCDIPSFIPDYFGAEFWHNIQTYLDHSPVFQAKDVTTPALIQHGDADVRVPITQGYEYYNALRRQGVDTRMIVFPRQPHGLNEPRMLLKAMQTNLEWFQKHIKTDQQEEN